MGGQYFNRAIMSHNFMILYPAAKQKHENVTHTHNILNTAT